MSSSPAATRPGGAGAVEAPAAAGMPVSTIVAGRYRILGRMAEGGMGVVYKAEHTLSKKKLAIKLLHPHLCHGKQAVERFRREVSAAAEIDHPGIVQVFDAGVDTDGSFYMAMELLEGESLGERTRREWPGTRTAVAMIAEMCEPLARAHAKGFVHRDLKPDNVFVARDPETGRQRLKLLDFGLAREVTQRRGPTMSGVTFGTPEYMSPEQCMSAKKAGVPSDVWSVGVMLYELLAGRHPFVGETPNAVMANAIKEPLPPLAAVAPHVPADLAAIVERCLEKDPSARPAHAGEVGDLLRDLLEHGELDESKPASPVMRRSDADDDEDASAEIDALRVSPGVPLGPPRDARTSYVGLSRGRPWWPWAVGSAVVMASVGVLFVVITGGGGAPIVATSLPADPSAPTPAPAEVALGPGPGQPAVEVAPGPAEAAQATTAQAPVVERAVLEAAVPEGSGAEGSGADGVVERSGAEGSGVEGPVAGAPVAESVGEGVGRAPRTRRAPAEVEEVESALDQAQACLARGDTRCAVAALQGARGAPAMALLVDVYSMQGRSADARSVMQSYVRRYPRGPRTAEYERQLGLSGD